MSARFARIHALADTRFAELLATGQTLETIECLIDTEFRGFPNLRSNQSQICKHVLKRIREARRVEVDRATSAAATTLPSPRISQSPQLGVGDQTSASKTARWNKLSIETGAKVTAELLAFVPTTISPVSLEYVGTHLTTDQLYYNSLAQRVNTEGIISTRIKRGMEKSGELLEEATMRAHSLAECEVALLAGHLIEMKGKMQDFSEPKNKRIRVQSN